MGNHINLSITNGFDSLTAALVVNVKCYINSQMSHFVSFFLIVWYVFYTGDTQVCSRCACLQLRWIPFTARASLCRLTTSWTRPGSPSSGISCWWEHIAPVRFSEMCVCVYICVCFSFPPASASYILLQFAQYGNIQKHKVGQFASL